MLGMVARAGMPIAAVRGNRMKCHVLVISGPSGTGKSTITQEMLKRAASAGISTSAIHQDSYFIGPKPDSYWTQAPKESPDTVDMPALRAAIAAAIADETNELLLVEGFLLLQDEPIMAKVDAVMFLTCDQETCLGRRLSAANGPHMRVKDSRYTMRSMFGRASWLTRSPLLTLFELQLQRAYRVVRA